MLVLHNSLYRRQRTLDLDVVTQQINAKNSLSESTTISNNKWLYQKVQNLAFSAVLMICTPWMCLLIASQCTVVYWFPTRKQCWACMTQLISRPLGKNRIVILITQESGANFKSKSLANLKCTQNQALQKKKRKKEAIQKNALGFLQSKKNTKNDLRQIKQHNSTCNHTICTLTSTGVRHNQWAKPFQARGKACKQRNLWNGATMGVCREGCVCAFHCQYRGTWYF